LWEKKYFDSSGKGRERGLKLSTKSVIDRRGEGQEKNWGGRGNKCWKFEEKYFQKKGMVKKKGGKGKGQDNRGIGSLGKKSRKGRERT